MLLWQSSKRIAAFAAPIAATGVINMLAGFIAMMMVARIGTLELAAGALASSTFYILLTLSNCAVMVVSILISHARGRGDHQDIGLLFRCSIVAATILAVPVSLGIYHADRILVWFHQDPRLIALSVGYFHFGAWLIWPSLMMALVSQLFTGIARPRLSMFIMLAMLPFMVIASYALILGHWGLPRLGLAGVNAATLVVDCVFAVCAYAILPMTALAKKYHLFSRVRLIDWRKIGKMLTFGLPIGIQFAGEIAAMTLATYFLGHYGANALAGAQIVGQYAMFLVMCFLGIAQAVSVNVSEALAQCDRVQILGYVYGGVMVIMFVFVPILIGFFLFPHALASVFIGQHEGQAGAQIMQYARWFFYVAAMTMFADAFRNMLAGALRGLHDSITPMVIGLLCLWLISIPLSYWLGLHLALGAVILRLAFASGFVVAVMILSVRFAVRLQKCTDVAQAR